ncbi:MAG TPA: hypothetical protein PLE12_05575 [Propionicimonas sp.]|jgi:hypothetical protein|nr:hypothetical protein [Propionicimonas sp.]
MDRAEAGSRKGHALSITVLVGVLVLALGSVTAVSVYLNRLNSAVEAMATGQPPLDYPGRPGKPVVNGVSPLDFLVWVTDSDQKLLSVQLVHLSAGRDQLGVIGLSADLAAGADDADAVPLRRIYAEDPLLAGRQVEQLLDVRIDHLARVGLDSFDAVVEALGGLGLPASAARGSTDMGGVEGWVSAAPDATARVERISGVVTETVTRLGMGQAMLNPMQFDRVLHAIEHCVVIDSAVRPGELESVLVESKVRADEVTAVTLPTSALPGADARRADPTQLAALRAALAADEVAGFGRPVAQSTPAVSPKR